MTIRVVKFKETAAVVPCPKCGNKTDFTINSDYCAEDCCEVWAVCKCGYQTPHNDRYEDVWGGCGDENVMAAISCWNEAMSATTEAGRKE